MSVQRQVLTAARSEIMEHGVASATLVRVAERAGIEVAALRREFPDPDDATVRMIRSAIREGPVRSLALMSGGLVRLAHVDALLAALNGHWGAVRRSVSGAVTGALPAVGRRGNASARPTGP